MWTISSIYSWSDRLCYASGKLTVNDNILNDIIVNNVIISQFSLI